MYTEHRVPFYNINTKELPERVQAVQISETTKSMSVGDGNANGDNW